jgi:hypothetical protein
MAWPNRSTGIDGSNLVTRLKALGFMGIMVQGASCIIGFIT